MRKLIFSVILMLFCAKAAAITRDIALQFNKCTKSDLVLQWQGYNFSIGGTFGSGVLTINADEKIYFMQAEMAVFGSHTLKISSLDEKFPGSFTLRQSFLYDTLEVQDIEGSFTFSPYHLVLDDYGNNLLTVFIGYSSITGGSK